MADLRSFFMQPEQAQQTPRGGLAPEERGGLSKFVENVGKGLETVLSNPLYQRAWSGFVSGQAQDATAGPAALEAIKQANAPNLQDELNYYRIRQMQRAEEDDANKRAARQRLQRVDPRNYGQEWAREFPEEAGPIAFREGLRPASSRAPSVKAVAGPDGNPIYVPTEEAVGKAPYYKPSGNGISIDGYDAEGRPLIRIGGSGGQSPITNSTRTEVEKDTLDIQANLSRLSDMRDSFSPELLQIGPRLSSMWTSAKAKAGVDLSEEETSMLERFADIRSASAEMSSYLLNQLSGAAISEHEYERLKQFIPVVGTGLTDGDDYVTYNRKMQQLDRRYRLVLARYAYATERGLPVSSIPLLESELEKKIGRAGMERFGIEPRKAKASESVSGGSDPRFPEIDIDG